MGANGDDVRAAVRDTVASAGRSVAFSGVTTALSLAALLFFRETFFRSLAIGGVAAVIIAATVAVLVLPALITLLGLEAQRETSPRGVREGAALAAAAWSAVVRPL